jgi:hypothetical protein
MAMLGLISRPSQNSRILLLSKPAGAARAIGVEKQSLVRNACLAERADDFGHAFLDLEQVAVVARHGLGAGQRDALAVGQKEHIRCLAFLSSLVGNLLAAPPGGWLPSNCTLDMSSWALLISSSTSHMRCWSHP